VDETWELRLAKNERFFRDANEAAEHESGRSDPNFVCECSRRGCIARVSLTRPEYEHVRADGRRFFVAPGHENPLVEVVVEQHESYSVVEKIGIAGRYVDRHNPRDGAR